LFRERYIDKLPVIRAVFYRIGGVSIFRYILDNCNFIFRGMSIIATYEKAKT